MKHQKHVFGGHSKKMSTPVDTNHYKRRGKSSGRKGVEKVYEDVSDTDLSPKEDLDTPVGPRSPKKIITEELKSPTRKRHIDKVRRTDAYEFNFKGKIINYWSFV